MPVSREQIGRARRALNWSFARLAKRSGVDISTLREFEKGDSLSPQALRQVAQAMMRAGAEFVPGGVRIAYRPRRRREGIKRGSVSKTNE